MTFMSSHLDPDRVADLAADPDWAARKIDMPAAKAAYEALQVALLAKRQTPGVSYAEFRSEFMGCDVRIGYQWEETADFQGLRPGADAVLTEVWVGAADLGQHLEQRTADALENELRVHLQKAAT